MIIVVRFLFKDTFVCKSSFLDEEFLVNMEFILGRLGFKNPQCTHFSTEQIAFRYTNSDSGIRRHFSSRTNNY